MIARSSLLLVLGLVLSCASEEQRAREDADDAVLMAARKVREPGEPAADEITSQPRIPPANAFRGDAFLERVIAGNVEAVKRDLDRGSSPDTRAPDGSTALMFAVWQEHDPVMEALLGAGAEVSARGRNGTTALQIAMSNCVADPDDALGNAVRIASLVGAGAARWDRAKALSASTSAPAGASACRGALVRGVPDEVEPDPDHLPGPEPLLTAARLCDQQGVNAGVGGDLGSRDPAGPTALPLALACPADQATHLALMQPLLGAGMDLDARADDGTTPLMIAARNGDLEVVDALVTAGADPSIRGMLGSMAMDQGIGPEAEEIAQVLRDAGLVKHTPEYEEPIPPEATPVEPIPPPGENTLLIAVERGDTAELRMLLSDGADPDMKLPAEMQGGTVLRVAASMGEVETVQILLNAGATVDATTYHGSTPLWEAAYGGHILVIEALLRVEANVNAASSDGRTPLMVAASRGHADAVEALLEAGADPALQDQQELDAAAVAERAGFAELAGRLRQAAPPEEAAP